MHSSEIREGEPFGVLLRRFRLAAGLSQEALAEKARISTEAVGSLERGVRRAPQRQTLALLIDALGLDEAGSSLLALAAVRPSLPRRRTLPTNSLQKHASLLPGQPPAALSTFFGRETERSALRALLVAKRLVTIVGPGGIGKSRLALETAASLRDRFVDGTAFVAFAAVAPGTSLFAPIAAALDVNDEGRIALSASIAAAIRDRRLLLILDNCEHVADAAAEAVLALTSTCPDLHILATSREPLRLDGEQVFRLGSLPTATAIALFVDRAAAITHHRAEGEPDLQTIAEICERVDRIPLAIELAASANDVLDLRTILARLRERMALPVTLARNAPVRHLTVTSLVDWSHGRLDAKEAAVFRRFAVFAGGCRLDDAEAVLPADELTPHDVVHALAALHQKSMLEIDRGDPPRFTMLQTIRDYALEQLELSGDGHAAAERHTKLYLGIAAGFGGALRGPAQRDAILRISADLDNIRSALPRITPGSHHAERGLRAVAALSLYWMRVGALTEAAEQLAALDLAAFPPSAGLAAALAGEAFVAINRGNFDRALEQAARARAAAGTAGDEWLETYAAIAECTARLRQSGRADFAEINAIYEQALRTHDQWLIGDAAALRGQSLVNADHEAAVKEFSHALECAEESGDPFAIASVQLRLAKELARSDPARAGKLISAALTNFTPNAFFGRALCIEVLAEIAAALGHTEDVAILVGVATNLLRRSGESRLGAALSERLSASRLSLPKDSLDWGESAALDNAFDRIATFLSWLDSEARHGVTS